MTNNYTLKRIGGTWYLHNGCVTLESSDVSDLLDIWYGLEVN